MKGKDAFLCLYEWYCYYEVWLTFAKYLLAGTELTEIVICRTMCSGNGVTGAMASTD